MRSTAGAGQIQLTRGEASVSVVWRLAGQVGVIERSSGTLAQQRSACTQVCAAGLGYLAFVTITLELYYCYYFQNFLLPLLLL